MKKWADLFYAMLVLCMAWPAFSATTSQVTEPTWTLNAVTKLGTQASEAACITAAKAQPVGMYECLVAGATLIAVRASTTTPPVTCTAPLVLQNGVCVSQPPPVTTGAAWIYHDKLIWANDLMNYGDYVYDYQDTTGAPQVGTHDIKVTGTQGGFQPGAPLLNFDTTGYNFLIVSLKPTQPNNFWIAGAESSDNGGDTVIPGGLNPDLRNYCTTFIVNQWSTCKIPLHNGGLNIPVGQHLRKIMLQEQAPSPTKNTWYVAELGFVAQ